MNREVRFELEPELARHRIVAAIRQFDQAKPQDMDGI
jgi:hypothetical protein